MLPAPVSRKCGPVRGMSCPGCPGRAGTRTWAQMPALCPPLSIILAKQELGGGAPLTRAALAPWDHQLCPVCQTGSHWDSGAETGSRWAGQQRCPRPPLLLVRNTSPLRPLGRHSPHVPCTVSAHTGRAMPGVVAGRRYSVSGDEQTHPDPTGRADSSQHPKGRGHPLLTDRTTCLDGGPHVRGGGGASFPISHPSSG